MLFRSTSGTTHGGTTLTITGTGFITGASAKVGSLSLESVVVDSPTQITAVTPETNNAGTFDITVTTSGGTSDIVGTVNDYTYVVGGVTVTSSTNASVPQGKSNHTVTINGTGFRTGAGVTVSGVGVTVGTVTFVNSTQLTAVVSVAQGAAVGDRSITVTNLDTGTATLAEIGRAHV